MYIPEYRVKFSKAHPDQWSLNRDSGWSGMGSRDKLGEATCPPARHSKIMHVIKGTVFDSEVSTSRMRRLGEMAEHCDQSKVHLPHLQLMNQARGITKWAFCITSGISSDFIIYPMISALQNTFWYTKSFFFFLSN